MNIKDYLPFYLGCDVDTNITSGYIHPCGGVRIHVLTADNLVDIFYMLDNDEDSYCRPHLFSLNDMTDEEKVIMARMSGYKHVGNYNEDGSISDVIPNDDFEDQKCLIPQADFILLSNRFYPDVFAWLLSRHFDLFGLIEAGLAIDKTKLD